MCNADASPPSFKIILSEATGTHLNGTVAQIVRRSEAIPDEANAASDPARTAWLAFLLLLTYVVVTLAHPSAHKDLLLNRPVRLPIINADIPLVGL